MGKLYVFGNGLDKHYGLKTAPADFSDILRNKRIYNEFEDATEIFAGYNVGWGNFEEDIAEIDLEQLENNQVNYPDYVSDHEYDRDGVITKVAYYLDSLRKAIFDSLSEMVINAEQNIQSLPMDSRWLFEDEDMILSFNYTSTIEQISDTKNIPILHIHGFFNAGDFLILGYKEPLNSYNYLKFSNPEDGDYYMEKQLSLINDFYMSLKKEMQFIKLESFLKKAKRIDEIFVYGHSLGKVDAPYFEMIEQTLHPKKWNVSYHNRDDEVMFNKNQLSFADKIHLFLW